MNNLENNFNLDDLNTAQKAAVLHINGPLAVIAGAGSGKTKMLTYKIAYLLSKVGIPSQRILALTFTNKAANEMKKKVKNLIGSKAEELTISTYHSLCAKILRREIKYFDYPSNFNILDSIDQKQILSAIYKKHQILSKTISYSMVLEYISTNKVLNIDWEQKLAEAKKDYEKILAFVYRDYQEELKRLKSLDFDDLIIFVQKLFEENYEVKKYWSEKFDYILVDEFQDTSFMQYEIIKHLAIKNNITIVGDPDQTIFTWRWADVDLINNFKDYFHNSQIIKLEENYRSTKTILNSANKLIKYNKNRIEKNLFTQNVEGDSIEFYYSFSDEAESRWIVQNILNLKRNKIQLKDIAIIYRANYLSQSIEKVLIKENINYIIFGGIRFYQRQEIKDVISYLKVINNGDEISLLRMINVPIRSIGNIAINKLVEFSKEKQKPLFETIIDHFEELPIQLKQRNELAKFINLINQHSIAAKKFPISKIIKSFLSKVGYINIYKSVGDKGRIDNISQLINSIEDWEKTFPTKTLDDYLNEISLFLDQDNEYKSNDFISLLTAHSSKGLEFKCVFILGFSESVFPSNRAIDERGNEALEEERRLAYVAITRAKEKLFISSSKGYYSEHSSPRVPSRFLREMGIKVNKFTSEYIAFSYDPEQEETRNNNIVIGDKVSHMIFGQGVVVKVGDELIDIKFKNPYGVKTLMKNHKSIERIGN